MKGRKNIKGVLIAVVIVASAFAVIASATVDAPLGNPAGFSVNKETVPADAVYNVSDPIDYTVRLRNPGEYNATVDIWDVLPNGTIIQYPGNPAYFTRDSDPIYWNFSTVVKADWDPDQNCKFTNTVRVVGKDDNPTFPDGDDIDVSITRSSAMICEPPEVPVLTPIALIALVGLLTVIATITISRKKK